MKDFKTPALGEKKTAAVHSSELHHCSLVPQMIERCLELEIDMIKTRASR
jgi:hypothetical protein